MLNVVEAMREAGLDVSARKPKKIELEMQLHAELSQLSYPPLRGLLKPLGGAEEKPDGPWPAHLEYA